MYRAPEWRGCFNVISFLMNTKVIKALLSLFILLAAVAAADADELLVDFTNLDGNPFEVGTLTESRTFRIAESVEITLPQGSTFKSGYLAVPKGSEIVIEPVDMRIITVAKWSFTAANYGKFARMRAVTLSETENTGTVNSTYNGGARTLSYTVSSTQELRAKSLAITLEAAPLRSPQPVGGVAAFTSSAVVRWYPVEGATGYRVYLADESLFDETFDDTNYMGGNDGILAGRGTGLSFPQRLSDFGWEQAGTVSTDSCLRVGSSSSLGWVRMPPLPITSPVVLFCRAVAVGGDEECMTLTLNGQTEDVAVRSDRFTVVTRRVAPNSDGELTATFAKYAMADRMFLDDVKVFADRGSFRYIEVTSPSASSLTIDGLMPGRSYSCFLLALGDGITTYDSQCSATLTFTTPRPSKGDINGDGSVDSSDVSALLEMVLAGGIDASVTVVDFNDDGQVDSSDVSALLEVVLSGSN